MRARKPGPRALRAAERARAAMFAGTPAIERRFVRDVRGILAGVHTAMLSYLAPAIHRVTGDGVPPVHASGIPGRDIDAVMRAIIPQIGPKVASAHAKMAGALERNYAASMAHVLPISYQQLEAATRVDIGIARDNSIKLVENASRVYADQVRNVFGDPNWTQGKRWEELRDALLERADVSESRAELIARDQTLKLNGAINQSRQQAAGVDSYVWSTSGDERVRESHAAVDGDTFLWSAGPDFGHPGQDFQCRCVALPIIPELEGI